MDNPFELLKGSLDMLVLKALTWGPRHGYAVTRWLRERTGEVLEVDDAALYQALHRMERRGWVESEWGLSENNRRAKFYRLTSQGRQQLLSQKASWRRYARAVHTIMEAERA